MVHSSALSVHGGYYADQPGSPFGTQSGSHRQPADRRGQPRHAGTGPVRSLERGLRGTEASPGGAGIRMRREPSRAYLDRAREVFDIETEALARVRDRLGEEFSRTVTLMLEALSRGGKIIITGIGKNLPVGQKIAATLTSTGAPAVFLHPLEAMHGDLGIVARGDVVLALSYTGETEELATLLPILKRSGARIVAVTGNPQSTLASHSDLVLDVRVDREACPFNMAPTASTTAILALGDALAMVLLEARGFRREDYALLHPGGAIGRTLLLRAADIMRTGERLARVKVGTTVKEAILAMTSARAGSVAVTDHQGRLRGIFT
ncbi:MAG TPA: KpsF/GutQ family sugar-phosphate isomerase, partial [Kiritimatiellae bacterium]|nr:KpsF/GutQ family sugar-phosphate isomerase [Kiritimatiellia bacterium]